MAAAAIATTCGQCLAGCGILVAHDRSVSGDPDDPVSRGYLCANGRAAIGIAGHPGRLHRPLVRRESASWNDALNAAAGFIRSARDESGPNSVGLYFGAGDPAGSMAFLAAAGFFQGLGSGRHYNVIGLEATHRYVVAEAMTGNALAVPRPDLDRAGGLIVLGCNPLVSNDEGGLASSLDAMHKRKAVTVVLDPRRTELARRATVHLAVRPGTDAEVLLAMIHVVLASGRSFDALSAEADGLDRLRQLAASMPPSRAAAIAGVDANEIDRAARLLARVAPVAALSRLGTAMTRRGTVDEWLTWALVGCLGGLGHDGGLVLNDGFLDLAGMMARAPRMPGTIVGVLPPADLADAMLDEGPNRLRVLVVVAADLIASLPNTTKLERALRRLDALIVLDVMPTPTTELATVVLPCAHHLEKDDVALLLPDRVPLQYARASRPIAPPPGEARTELAIFADLAKRLRTPLFGARALDAAVRLATRWAPGSHPSDSMSPKAAMQVVVPLLSRFGLSWKRLVRGHLGAENGRPTGRALRAAVKRPGGRFDLAPVPFVEALAGSLDTTPAPQASTGPLASTPSLGSTTRLAPSALLPPTALLAHTARLAPSASALSTNALADRTLMLSTCNRSREFINSKLVLVGRAAREPFVQIHPDDAAALQLAESSHVRLDSDTGSLTATVRLDDTLRRGTAGMYFGTPGINRLTSDTDRDPLSQIPAFAHVRCRVSHALSASPRPADPPTDPGGPS